jgi:site-specific recombinase XerD
MTGALVSISDLPPLPARFAPMPEAARRYIEFFATKIRNPNTRRAYARASAEFAAWCADPAGITGLRDIEPAHVAVYVETQLARLAAPSVKQQVDGIRMLFDWLAGDCQPRHGTAARNLAPLRR